MATYLIPTENLANLRGRIAKLAKRAEKLGCGAISLTVGDIEKRISETGAAPVLCYRVELEGAAPILNGWEFVATLTHIALETGQRHNVMRVAPRYQTGDQLPVAYRTADPRNCDHCHIRIARRDTYVLRRTDGSRWAQVGSSCLADFLGHADPHGVAAFLEALLSAREACEDGESGGGGSNMLELASFVAHVAAVVRVDGYFLGRAKADAQGQTSTVSSALEVMFPGPESKVDPEVLPTAADRTRAEEVLAWVHGLEPAALKSDYMHNLFGACGRKYIEHKLAGIAGSAVAAYAREVEKRVAAQVEARQTVNSKHLGTEGSKISFRAATTRAPFPIAGDYGTSFLYRFVTTGGDVVIWFSTRAIEEIQPGVELELKATVKRHQTGRDGKTLETVITRAKVLSPAAQAA